MISEYKNKVEDFVAAATLTTLQMPFCILIKANENKFSYEHISYLYIL